MVLFDKVLEFHPDGPWAVYEDFHEAIFSKWVFRAHDRNLRFDFHIPICDRTQSELKSVLATFIAEEAKEISLAGLTTPILKSEGDKWKAFSAMQKAIRRGLFHEAWRSAHALWAAGQGDAMWRRLVITSMEDIGLADPYAAAFTCWAAGNRKARVEIGEKQVLAFVLSALCAAPKSRDLCDAVVYNFLPHTIEDEFAEAAKWEGDTLVEIAADLSRPMMQRYLAHWRMFGPKFKCTSHDNPKADPLQSFVLYEKLKLPILFQYIAYESYRKSGEALGIPVPFLWQYMTCSPWAKPAPDPFEDAKNEMCHGVLAATFDKHTWQGKGALKRFLAQCKPVREYLNKHCKGDHMAALERAVFYVEGALLRPRLFYEGAREFYFDVLTAKLISNGFPDFETGRAFYSLVQENLGLLNKLREK